MSVFTIFINILVLNASFTCYWYCPHPLILWLYRGFKDSNQDLCLLFIIFFSKSQHFFRRSFSNWMLFSLLKCIDFEAVGVYKGKEDYIGHNLHIFLLSFLSLLPRDHLRNDIITEVGLQLLLSFFPYSSILGQRDTSEFDWVVCQVIKVGTASVLSG